jgi:hypothetical protein
MEYYSAFKKKILPFMTIYVNLRSIMVSEISQTQKEKHCMIYDLKKGRTQRNCRTLVARTGMGKTRRDIDQRAQACSYGG